MILKLISLHSVLLLTCSIAFTQTAPPPTQAPAATAQSPGAPQQAPAAETPAKLVLKEGTDVKLKFAQDLSSKTAAEDDPVNLVLDEDLKVGDVVVARPEQRLWAGSRT